LIISYGGFISAGSGRPKDKSHLKDLGKCDFQQQKKKFLSKLIDKGKAYTFLGILLIMQMLFIGLYTPKNRIIISRDGSWLQKSYGNQPIDQQ
jgi:hypothetical protein